MNVLVIGGGGREHALCWKLAQSPLLGRLYCLPGNAGTAGIATNVPGEPADVGAALEIARREQIDLTIVGPEAPLAAGIVDAFQEAGLRIFGPTRLAARLETDKAFAKQLMRQHAIPTADWRLFTDYITAKRYIETRDEPLVVKACGLAAGKGAIVCDDPADAMLAAEKMLVGKQFGAAGEQVIVEEKLAGREVSLMALVDGRTLYLLQTAQDHKRLGDGDTGPNTGGMGAFSPTDTLSERQIEQVISQILVPVADGMIREDAPYRGLLYAGLMLTPAGPKVLEFNCRFGDPEAQPLLIRLRSDLLEVIDATLRGELAEIALDWDDRTALCVVMASGGYPGTYQTGKEVHGLDAAQQLDDVVVFHAGTKLDNGRVVTSGGRVLGVTALGSAVAAARSQAYNAVERIEFEGATWRTDLGSQAAR